jgi:hypothetical protein
MSIKNFSRNSKIKKSSQNGNWIINWSIPNWKAKDGTVTCPSAAACITGCYVSQGTYNFPVVQAKMNRNLALTRQADFIPLIVKEIRAYKKLSHVRIHDSGDFYSEAYLFNWLTIMRDSPSIQFYAYTKEVKLFKRVEKAGLMPDNFTYIYSFGGRNDSLINVKTDRHSIVFDSVDALRQGYINASENDLFAITDNIRVGLIYHGSAKKNNFKKVG